MDALSPGRFAKSGEHLHDSDKKITSSLVSRIAQDVAAVKQLERPGAFHRTAVGHAVEAALVVSTEAPSTFRDGGPGSKSRSDGDWEDAVRRSIDGEDDAFGCPQKLITQIG